MRVEAQTQMPALQGPEPEDERLEASWATQQGSVFIKCNNGGRLALLVGHLPSIDNVLGSIPPSLHKPCMLVQACYPSTQEVEAERSRAQGHLGSGATQKV